MLTFLREIRKSMIESGSAQKYLLYAIGEIALVVIGILIALQINNWNQESINRTTEKEILSRFVQDLKTDLKEIDLTSESNEWRLRRGVWVLEQLGHNVESIKNLASYQIALNNFPNIEDLLGDSFGHTLTRIRFYFLFEESKITLQEIMATGKLNVIRDNDIKIAIQTHYAEISDRRYLQRLLATNRDDLVKYLLSKNISVLNQLSMNEVLTLIESPLSLIARIENFLMATDTNYKGVTLNDNSIKNRTHRLIERIETYTNGL